MADAKEMAARHAFGSEKNIEDALKKGSIDKYDILFLDEKKVGWIDRSGNPVIIEDKIEKISVGDTALEIVNKSINIPLGAGLKQSEEVEISEDGTLSVGVINFRNLVQGEGEIIIFDGGASAE